MISYDIDVGYAIGRLIRTFFEVWTRIAGSPDRVHFSFTRIGDKICPNLPQGFGNLLEFDYRNADAASLERLSAYVRKHDIQVAMGLDISIGAKTARFLQLARESGVRHIVAYWGAPMSSENTGLRLLLKRLEVRWLRPYRPDFFLFESHAMRRLGVHGRGIPHGDTAVVPTGVDARRFRPRPECAQLVKERLAIPDARHIVVFAGHLHARKGVHVLMQALNHIVLTRKRSDVHLLFLGNRNNEEEGFRHLWEPVREYITFGGYRSDVIELFSGCTMGCIPSTGWDSFPMSSLEMQACGLPVIVSDWQGVPETIEHGVSGLVVATGDSAALGDAILRVIDDRELHDRLSSGARHRIESAFTEQHQVQRLTEVIGARIGVAQSA